MTYQAAADGQRLGVPLQGLRSACQQLGIKHKFTRAYRPQTNGKAERFIQSALREWAYGWTYQNSDAAHARPWRAGSTTTTGTARTAASAASRPCPDFPSRNNLLTVHS